MVFQLETFSKTPQCLKAEKDAFCLLEDTSKDRSILKLGMHLQFGEFLFMDWDQFQFRAKLPDLIKQWPNISTLILK